MKRIHGPVTPHPSKRHSMIRPNGSSDARPLLTLCLAMVSLFVITLPVQGISQTLNRQNAHIKIKDPLELAPKEAEAKYKSILEDLQKMYAVSKDPAAVNFPRWTRTNTAPYLSGTHGNRYVNNYNNSIAKDYVAVATGKQKEMPVGSVLAKDSFTVTKEGKVFGGALFLMEKLPKGISKETGNWRYWMILPDGSILGDTEADSAGEVAFCHTCHKIKSRRDFLFYIPKGYRK